MRSFRNVFLAAALAALTPLGAQEPASDPFGEAIDVRVVNVEAVVTDKRGNRVLGLAVADFRLLVDGKEVPPELGSSRFLRFLISSSVASGRRR